MPFSTSTPPIKASEERARAAAHQRPGTLLGLGGCPPAARGRGVKIHSAAPGQPSARFGASRYGGGGDDPRGPGRSSWMDRGCTAAADGAVRLAHRRLAARSQCGWGRAPREKGRRGGARVGAVHHGLSCPAPPRRPRKEKAGCGGARAEDKPNFLIFYFIIFSRSLARGRRMEKRMGEEKGDSSRSRAFPCSRAQ